MFLENIRVDFISLVKAGANKKAILWKSGEGEPPISWDVPISKVDEEKRLVYGIVYSPGEIDTQGDYTDAEQIEKAAHLFLKGSKTGSGVDKGHSFQPEGGAFVAESWILKEGDSVFQDSPVGSWAVAIRIDDNDLWESVKNGDIGGISMGGIADMVEKSNESHGNGVLAEIKKLLFGKDDDMDKEQVEKIVKDAIGSNGSLLAKEDVIGIIEAAMKEIVGPINERIEKIEASTDGSSQDGDGNPGGDVDYAKIGSEIAKSITEG